MVGKGLALPISIDSRRGRSAPWRAAPRTGLPSAGGSVSRQRAATWRQEPPRAGELRQFEPPAGIARFARPWRQEFRISSPDSYRICQQVRESNAGGVAPCRPRRTEFPEFQVRSAPGGTVGRTAPDSYRNVVGHSCRNAGGVAPSQPGRAEFLEVSPDFGPRTSVGRPRPNSYWNSGTCCARNAGGAVHSRPDALDFRVSGPFRLGSSVRRAAPSSNRYCARCQGRNAGGVARFADLRRSLTGIDGGLRGNVVCVTATFPGCRPPGPG
jgi:hypothetical protein